MKFLTALFTLIVGVSIAKAATPAYQSFDTGQFSYTSGHIWIKSGAKMTNPVFNTSITLNGVTITAWPTGGTNATNFDILDVGTIFVTNGITLGGTTATNWVWVNNSGTIVPAPGQTTNTLRFTSGLPDATNSVAAIIDTASAWANKGAVLQQWNSGGVSKDQFFSKSGTLVIGPNTIDYWGQPNAGEQILSWHNAGAGDPDGFEMFIGAGLTGNSGGGGSIDIYGSSSTATLALDSDQIGGNVAEFRVDLSTNLTGSVHLDVGPIRGVDFTPSAADDGTLPFKLGTSITKTSGLLFTLDNNETNKFTVDYAGNVSAAGTVTTPTLNVGTITYTNPPGLPTFTVATLPGANTNTGAQAWVTDVVTPEGTGAIVFSDGSIWRTMQTKLQAYSDVPSYLLECLKRGWSGSTPLTTARMQDFFVAGSGIEDGIGFVSTATGGSVNWSAVTNRNFFSLATGTTTNGVGYTYGHAWLPNAGDYIEQATEIALPNLCDATDKYWVMYGLNSGNTTFGADGIFFLYDLYNTQSHGSLLTNQWLCVTRSNSVNTVTASGVSVDTAWNRLNFIAQTNRVVFYINGTSVATNTTQIPTAVVYANRHQMAKVSDSSTTARSLRIDWSYHHMRYGTARTFYP